MLRLAFDFIIAWRETRTRPNAYDRGISPFRKNVWNGLIFLLRYLLIIFV
jgi:hypothetical protein